MEVEMTIFVPNRRQMSLVWLLASLFTLLFCQTGHAQVGIVNVSDRAAMLSTSSFDLNRAAAIPMLNSSNGGTNSPGAIQLWPRSVSWDRATDKFIQYYVQPANLKIGIRYNYNFTFNLESRNLKRGTATVPDGWYLLSMAAVLPAQDDIFEGSGIVPPKSIYERFVSSFTSYVYVSGGSFNQSVSFNLDNMTANGVMSNLYIELLPLAETCTDKVTQKSGPCLTLLPNGLPDDTRSTLQIREPYVPYVITLPFAPYVIPSGGSRDPDLNADSSDGVIRRNLRQYLTIAKAYRARQTRKASRQISPAQMAKLQNLNYVSLSTPWMKPFKPLFDGMMSAQTPGSIGLDDARSEKVMRYVCDIFTRKSKYYREHNVEQGSPFGMMGGGNFNYYAYVFDHCRNRFEELVAVSRITHIESFDPKLLSRVLQQPLKFNLMSNVLVSRGVSDDFSTSITATQKVPFGILFSPLEAFGFSVGGNMSISHSENHSSSASVAGSLAANLDFNVFVLNIHATKAQSCLAIRLIPDKRSLLYDNTPGVKNGFYICEGRSREKDVKEIYARVLFHPGQTPDVDIYDQLTQKTNFALRGDRDISAFFYLTSSDISPSLDSNSRIMPYQILSAAEGYFGATQGNSSNTVVTPVIFFSTKASVPSFTEKLRDQFAEFRTP